MRALVASRRDTISAALLNLRTGALSEYRPGLRFQTASIVKVDILETLLYEAEQRHRALTATEQDEATEMIEESDNDDATALWDDDGGAPAIASYDRSIGMVATSPDTAGYWGETLTTAADQIRLLSELLNSSSPLDAAARAYQLGLMRNVIPFDRWGVSDGPSAGVSVALKNGWVPIVDDNWEINSIGYVTGAGRRYLLAILTDHNPTEGYGIATVDAVSRLVWGALSI